MISQRHALGLLFLALALGFGFVAFAAARADQWVIAAASAVLGGWMGVMTAKLFRPH